MEKPTLAVHKFSSCDGCQLALLNMGEALVALSQRVQIKHFAEAGVVDEDALVDIALVEGSVVTAADQVRIQKVRKSSKLLVTMGACATSGGIQALKNLSGEASDWTAQIYPQPEFIDTLAQSSAIKAYVPVDFELWGCPISSGQVVAALNQLLFGVSPFDENEKLCVECKRQGNVCTVITQQEACLGPMTRAGCGALCPAFGRGCYGCYGPAKTLNESAIRRCFSGLGLMEPETERALHLIHPDSAQQGIRPSLRKGDADE